MISGQGIFRMPQPQVRGDACGCLANHGQLLYDGAADEVGLAEFRRGQAEDEPGNRIGGFTDVAQVQFFTPHTAGEPR
jgi:hypothetical protein